MIARVRLDQHLDHGHGHANRHVEPFSRSSVSAQRRMGQALDLASEWCRPCLGQPHLKWTTRLNAVKSLVHVAGYADFDVLWPANDHIDRLALPYLCGRDHRVISLRHMVASLAVLMRRQSTRLHQCRMSCLDTPASAVASDAVIAPRANSAKAARFAMLSFICRK